MQDIHTLLSKRWILRREEPEVYYRLKDNYHIYSDFIKQKLGYNIIINPILIKAEKIPGSNQRYMGIQAFKEPKSYVFLCLVLMYLEEKEPHEQFVLGQVIDYVKNQYPSKEIIDWTVYNNRKQLIHVLRFCIEEGMIIINDGEDKYFTNSEQSVEVLYENTGASKYFMRRFSFDINELKTINDFDGLEWINDDKDRGLIRRHRIYRRLFMEPIVYDQGQDDQDYLYIKNMRSVIRNDVETYLDGEFHLHKNGALILLNELTTHGFPNRKNISDIVIMMCGMIQSMNLERNEEDTVVISVTKWEIMIKELKQTFDFGWGKSYREMALSHMMDEINEFMTTFGMLEVVEHDVKLLPMIGKIKGNYPKTFWEQNNGKMADQ